MNVQQEKTEYLADFGVPVWEDETDEGCPDLEVLARIAEAFDTTYKLAISTEPQNLIDDNTQRGSRVARAVKTYTDVTYFNGELLETAMGDFLADFMHLCDGLHLDFDYLVDLGRTHHSAEITGNIFG